MILRTLAVLILAQLLAITTPQYSHAAESGETDADGEFPIKIRKFTGDLDEMAEERIIRVLMPYSRTFYYFDGAQPRGASYELVKLFEKFINEKYKTKTLKIHAVVIPTPREKLLPMLVAGKGDLAVGNLTITEERLAQVDFSDPLGKGVDEILVTQAGDDNLNSIFDLAGKEIHARKSSSYYASLVKLNETLKSLNKKQVKIIEADDNLEDEDLLEMLNAGLIEFMVIDSHKGEFWAQIFDNIQLHPEIKFRTEGKIGWAMRKDSPKLMAAVNEFVKDHKQGTLMGNILIKRYLHYTHCSSLTFEGLIQLRLLVGEGGEQQMVKIILLTILFKKPYREVETLHMFVVDRVGNVVGVLQVALDQDISHQGSLLVVFYKLIDRRHEFGTVLAHGPTDFSLGTEFNFRMQHDLIEYLGPEFTLMIVDDHIFDQSGVEQFKQVFILEIVFRLDDFDFFFIKRFQRFIELDQACIVAA